MKDLKKDLKNFIKDQLCETPTAANGSGLFNPNNPVIAVWKTMSGSRKMKFPTLYAARAAALQIIGGDDRISVHLYSAKSGKDRGRVCMDRGIYIWQYGKYIREVHPSGRLLREVW